MRQRFFLADARDVVRQQVGGDGFIGAYKNVHQYLGKSCDGFLLSHAVATAGARFSSQEMSTLLELGAPDYYGAPDLEFIGDSGAFSYINEELPTVSAADLVEFYSRARMTYGISPDHIVREYIPDDNAQLFTMESEESRRRVEITIDSAQAFWDAARGAPFTPIGAAQGWGPISYADCVGSLQRVGYRYIAVGGLVRKSRHDIEAILGAVDQVRLVDTCLHLLGVCRPEIFRRPGVRSFDTTSPLRRAYLDKRHNYWIGDTSWTAIRPKDDGELELVRGWDGDASKLARTLGDDPGQVRDYTRTLQDRPWERCRCRCCNDLGLEVCLLMGTERNRRRGFHNVRNFYLTSVTAGVTMDSWPSAGQ